MADFNYVKSQNTADKLIAKFGGKLKGTVVRMQSSGGTVTRPGRAVPTEIPCTCVAVDYTVRERASGNIEAGAKRIIISPLGLPSGFDLETTDKIRTADGVEYVIVPPVSKFKPTTLILFYDVQGMVG